MAIRKRLRSERGFSLVEITVAMVVGSIGLLALAGILVYAMQTNRRATDISIATALARQKIEQIKLTDYNYVIDQVENNLNPNGEYSPEEGLAYMELVVSEIINNISNLDEYIKYLKEYNG